MSKSNASAPIDRRGFVLGALGLAAAPLVAAIAGCSGDADAPAGAAGLQAGSAAGASATDSAAGSAAASAGSAAASGRVLVAYYSAQGHTEAVARAAADELGADLFAITPAEPYTADDLDYNDDSSRVSREHEDESLREVALETVTPEGFDDYETVLIGYPIWWGIAAWPVDSFITGNDFAGKTVFPFCTSASSGLGASGELLAEAAGTGDWQEGMRFRSSASEDDVRSWAAGLGL